MERETRLDELKNLSNSVSLRTAALMAGLSTAIAEVYDREVELLLAGEKGDTEARQNIEHTKREIDQLHHLNHAIERAINKELQKGRRLARKAA